MYCMGIEKTKHSTMKKGLLFGITALALLAGCKGNGNTDSAKEDSSAVETVAPTADNGKMESAPQEDNGQFMKAVPEPKKLYIGESGNSVDKIVRYLKSLGYKGSKKNVSTLDGDKTVCNYTYKQGDKSISVNYTVLMGTENITVTIKGDDEALEEYYKRAKKFQGKGDYWYRKVKKSGNKVVINAGMD